MIETLLEYDHSLFLYLNSLGIPLFDGFWMLMTNSLTNVVLYLFALFLFFRNTKNYKSLLIVLGGVAVLILVTDQVTNLFKFGFERLRPCHNDLFKDEMRLVKSHCGGLYSFFSGHSSNSFALATFFTLLLIPYIRKIGFLFFTFASLIAYSRVYIGVHFPIDIICGSLFGFLWGKVFFSLWNKWLLERV